MSLRREELIALAGISEVGLVGDLRLTVSRYPAEQRLLAEPTRVVAGAAGEA